MAGIRITLVEDVTSFLRGISRSEDALDEFSGSLDDMARDAQQAGDRAGDELADGVDAGTQDASTSVERLERSFRDLARDVSRHTRSAGDDVGDNMKRGYREAGQAAEKFGDTAEREGNRASETTEEFRDEARSNFSEVASSFSGEMSSAADLVQGTLGGLAGSLPGPVGIVTGLLAGIGGAMYASWQANAEQSAQAVADMYDDMIESGNDFLSESAIQEGVRKILLKEEGRATDFAEAMRIAEDAGLDLSVVLRGLAGDQQANELTQDRLRDKVTKASEAFDEARASGQDYNDLLKDTQDIQGYLDLLSRQSGEFQDAAKKAGLARDATTEWKDTLAQLPREVRTQLGLTRDIATEQDARAAYDGLGRKISPTVSPQLNTDDLDRQIRAYKPPLVQVNGEFTVRAGQRVV